MPGILQNDPDRRFSRRWLVGSAAALSGGLFVGRTVVAQEDEEDEGIVPIASTSLGPIPSTGTVRGGFVGDEPSTLTAARAVVPTGLAIEKIALDAQIEVLQIDDGVMQNPSGPWVVAWYEETARLGEIGNVVLAGHVDYWDVGPAVFFDLRELVAGDEVQVFGDNDVSRTYRVDSNETYDVEELTTGTIADLVGPTPDPVLTLITCGGEFDYVNGEYLSRMVVRATLVE